MEAFRRAFIDRHSRSASTAGVPIEPRRARLFAGHVRRKATEDRDNDYLHPWRLLRHERLRVAPREGSAPVLRPARPGAAVRLLPAPRHRRLQDHAVIPHCVDQVSLVEQVADALPRRVRPRAQGAPDVDRAEQRPAPAPAAEPPERAPRRAARELARADPRRRGVAVISSTVGLEALLYEKPVLTLGQPFYSGFGVTLDVESFARSATQVPELLALPARPGADPALPARCDAALLPRRAGARRPLPGERPAARRLARGSRARAAAERPPVPARCGCAVLGHRRHAARRPRAPVSSRSRTRSSR